MHSKHEDRERRVRALLETLNDPYQLPRHELADAGPAASKRVPCVNCNRSGKVVDRLRRVPRSCSACGGSGWRRRRKGDQAWDEYLSLPVRTAEATLKVPAKEFKLDEDIRRLWFILQRLEREDEPDSDDLLKALQAKDWLEKRGSYRELRRGLSVLQERSQHVYGAVWRRYLWNVELKASSHFDALVDIGVSFLCHEMRGDVRVPHTFAVAAKEARVKTVAELAEEGLGARKIAKALDMPLYKVKTILRDTRSVAPSDAAGTV